MPKQSKSVTDARRARALELKLQGHTWAEVAEVVGYSSAGSACQAAGLIIAQRSRHAAAGPPADAGCVFVFAEHDPAGFSRWAIASQLPAAWPQSTNAGGAPVALTRSPLA